MDPLSAILFLIVGYALVSLWSRLSDHAKQLFRLVSDRESEKETIARVHSDMEHRIRHLEQSIILFTKTLPDDDKEN